ncbi:hypothetical protein CesoFtcFv8_025758 [Champsocephalus esox]|uniref:Uncharacterized protein n=1 Tax=Champsocephalus esox TaxID=159716 RepID=A0AAN8B109_9TELE|nr:hypothetical protein CesoFtcFv8_025758 [Champsocephalus esox]
MTSSLSLLTLLRQRVLLRVALEPDWSTAQRLQPSTYELRMLTRYFTLLFSHEQGDVLLSSVLCLHEDDSTFLRLWHVEQTHDPDTEDIAVGLLMISARSTDTTLFCPESIAVVI